MGPCLDRCLPALLHDRQRSSTRLKAAHASPQWRDLRIRLILIVPPSTTSKSVILSEAEGPALALVVAFLPYPSPQADEV